MTKRFLPAVALLGGTILSTFGAAQAADVVEEPIFVEPAPVPDVAPVSTSGWYLRGDVGYARSQSTSGRYKILTKDSGGHNVVSEHHYEKVKASDGWTAGGGVGYRFNDFLRTDVTADYYSLDMRGRTPCAVPTSVSCHYDDKADVDLWAIMANVYADVYRYDFVTAYVGGGLGAAYVNYGTMRNKFDCPPGTPGIGKACGDTYEHEGESSWRFAYSLAAGLSWDLTDCLKLDTGYRYTRVASGDAFGWDKYDKAEGMSGAQGRDKGFNIHAVRAGLRYEFGGIGKGPGGGACGAPPPPPVEQVVYQEPVYK